MNHNYLILSLLFLFICISCDNNRHIRYYHVKKEAIKPTFIPQPSALSSVHWTVPTHWISTKGSSMRIGSFDIPFSNGKGDLSIIKLGGTAGGLSPNINRWRGQLNLSSHSEIEIQKYIQNDKSPLGQFQWLTISNPNDEETAFLISIFKTESHTIFVKLNATTNGIYELKSEFLNFCKSFSQGTAQ